MIVFAGAGTAQLPHDSAQVAVLLADGRLQLYVAFAEKPAREFKLAPFTVNGPHQLMLQGANPDHLFLLLAPRRNLPGNGTFTRIELSSGRIRSLPLVDGTITFTTFAIGPRSGLIYLLGRDPDGMIVQTLDPESFAIRRQWRARTGPTSPDSTSPVFASLGYRLEPWFATIDSAERDLHVAYHGGTGGTERFSIDSATEPVCVRHPRGACNRMQHGTLRTTSSGVVMTTGSRWLRREGPNGVVDSLDSQTRDHVMWFTLNAASTQAFVLGSCGYAAGLALVPLGPGESSRVLNAEVCGNRMALSPSGEWLAVAAVRDPPYASGGPGTLTYVLASTGKELRMVPTPAPPIDVLILR